MIFKVALITASLALTAHGMLEAQARATFGRFTYVERKDRMDDTDRSRIITTSMNATRMREAMLWWVCLDDGLNVVYDYDKYLGGDIDDEVRVRFRFDREPPSSEQHWGTMSRNRGAWMPMHRIAEFTENAKRANTVLLRVVDPLDGESLTDEFSLSGLTAALRRLGDCR